MPDIAHVVVLMLENRSFDSMLGRLYPSGGVFDGIPLGAQNTANGVAYPATPVASPLTRECACTPTPDPGELFGDMNQQLFNTPEPTNFPPPGRANMGGFAANYAAQTDAPPYDPAQVMSHFTNDQAKVLSTLALNFAVSDRWHASAPNQTWPNRFFLHTATANGYVNNSPPHFPYEMPTVFRQVADAGKEWRIYYHDMPQAVTLDDVLEHPFHLHEFEGEFERHAAAGDLPAYTFIEPRYFSNPLDGNMPNDQHPPHDMRHGERLMARVYNALRKSPLWPKLLFVITYDEHGGLYDHRTPPAAVSPDGKGEFGFTFDRYGVRVPAVLISPWIRKGAIARPPSDALPFDHTSVIATLRQLFGLAGPLTERDKAAPVLLDAIDVNHPGNPKLFLDAPDNDALPAIDVPDIVADAQTVADAHQAPPNHLQNALAQAAAQAEATRAGAPAPDLIDHGTVASAFDAVNGFVGRLQAGHDAGLG